MAHKLAEITATRDENGIVTLAQSWWTDDLREVFAGGEREVKFKGSALPEKSRSMSLWKKDSIEHGYRVTYEGPDWSMGEKPMHTYGYDSEFSEQPVETSPYLKTLGNRVRQHRAVAQILDLTADLVYPSFPHDGASSEAGRALGQGGRFEFAHSRGPRPQATRQGSRPGVCS